MPDEVQPGPWGPEREAAARAVLRERLGWLDAALALTDPAAITALVEQARADGLDHLLLLGMGGSVLAPVAIRDLLAAPERAATMTALDTTDPTAILRVDAALDPARTLVVVATKSGTTVETMSLYAHWWARVPDGRHFVAITDADSPLEYIARQRRFRATLPHTADPIGRFGAFTPVGALPAAWLGLNLDDWLREARDTAREFHQPDAKFPHFALTVEADIHGGRTKFTSAATAETVAFDRWLAEPLSEAMAGVAKPPLPILGEAARTGRLSYYDRLFLSSLFVIQVDELTGTAERRRGNLKDVAWSFVTWELGLPVAAALVEPHPDGGVTVDESKSRIKALLEWVEATAAEADAPPPGHSNGSQRRPRFTFGQEGSLWWPDTSRDADGPEAARMFAGKVLGAQLADARSSADALRIALRAAQPGETIALCPFLAPDEAEEQGLRALFAAITAVADGLLPPGSERDIAVTRWDGPALLHSTGQLLQAHDTGVTIVLTRQPERDLPIPGRPSTFSTLLRAQAQGFLESMWARERRAIGTHLASGQGLAHLAEQLQEAAS